MQRNSPCEEHSHLASGDLVLWAEVVVRWRVAPDGDACFGQSIDVVLVDGFIVVREPIEYGCLGYLESPDQEGGHLLTAHCSIWAEMIVGRWVASRGDENSGYSVDCSFEDAVVVVVEVVIFDGWKVWGSSQEGSHLLPCDLAIRAELLPLGASDRDPGLEDRFDGPLVVGAIVVIEVAARVVDIRSSRPGQGHQGDRREDECEKGAHDPRVWHRVSIAQPISSELHHR